MLLVYQLVGFYFLNCNMFRLKLDFLDYLNHPHLKKMSLSDFPVSVTVVNDLTVAVFVS